MPRHPTANVRCPRCDYAYSKQTTSCATPDGYRRKRRCLSDACGAQFTTYELHARDMNLIRAMRRYYEEGQAKAQGSSQEEAGRDERPVSQVRITEPGDADQQG